MTLIVNGAVIECEVSPGGHSRDGWVVGVWESVPASISMDSAVVTVSGRWGGPGAGSRFASDILINPSASRVHIPGKWPLDKTETDIDFHNIIHGASQTVLFSEPSAMLLSPGNASSLSGMQDALADSVAGVNIAFVRIFAGVQRKGGYSVHVKRVVSDGERVNIHAMVIGPPEGAVSASVLENPFVITAIKAGFPDGEHGGIREFPLFVELIFSDSGKAATFPVKKANEGKE